jgi:hypothetical protein
VTVSPDRPVVSWKVTVNLAFCPALLKCSTDGWTVAFTPGTETEAR